MTKLVCPLFAAAAVVIVVGCSCDSTELAEQNKETVRGLIEDVFNTGDVGQLAQYVSPEYVEVYENEAHPIGLEGAKAHVLGVRQAFPDLKITIEQQLSDGEWVISRVTARGTHLGSWLGMEPTGEYLEFSGVNIDRVVNGRIVEHGGAANLLGPLLQSGAIQIAGHTREGQSPLDLR